MAWVQTPQWFYDTTEAQGLGSVINARLKIAGATRGLKQLAAKTISRLFNRIKVNEDIFGNDPRLFYDAILRKRNFYNAAFCCGAGSIHRKEAVMNLALKDFAEAIKQ